MNYGKNIWKKKKHRLLGSNPLTAQEKVIMENHGPPREKNGSDHIREILNPREEYLIMEQNVDRQPPV